MFTDLLFDLLKTIDPRRVVHPILKLQERPLAYELYHRVRKFEDCNAHEFMPAITQAELNKRGSLYFATFFAEIYKVRPKDLDFKVREAMPDILIHDPWTNDHNLLVAEIKRAKGSWWDIMWDFAKLALFSDGELQYRERVFVLALKPNQSFRFWQRSLEERMSGDGSEIQVLFADIEGRRFHRMMLRHSVKAAETFLRTPPPEKPEPEIEEPDEAD